MKLSQNKKLNKMLQSTIKPALQQHQRLFLHPTYHPKDMSHKRMQEIYKETCGPMLGDLLDMRQLTVACHRPKNLRDLLIPSKLKSCPGKENNVEFHLKGTTLENHIEAINYEEIREKDVQEETINMKTEVARINSMLQDSGQATIIYNPYTRKHSRN